MSGPPNIGVAHPKNKRNIKILIDLMVPPVYNTLGGSIMNEIKSELLLHADAKLHNQLEGELGLADPSDEQAKEIINGATIGRRVGCGCKQSCEETS